MLSLHANNCKVHNIVQLSSAESSIMKHNVLHSLHRPYHRPLWIVKWVCCYYALRAKCADGKFWFNDNIIDLYFKLLEWLYKSYPKQNDGIPSREAVIAVHDYLWNHPVTLREEVLKDILSKERRQKGIETQVYSTYKAVTYFHNLAKEKLHIVRADGSFEGWSAADLSTWRKSSTISKDDRLIYIMHILDNDFHFFVSQCLLEKYIHKYGLDPKETIFDFMQQNYPLPRFNYNQRSHHNYYDVRRQWINLLRVITPSGSLTSGFKDVIQSNPKYSEEFNDINNKIADYTNCMKGNQQFRQQVEEFYETYNVVRRQGAVNDYVNLYDICTIMKMSYIRFNTFVGRFYESERTKRNIFFINIVSTIDQRKRFYIRETPVLKVKII